MKSRNLMSVVLWVGVVCGLFWRAGASATAAMISEPTVDTLATTSFWNENQGGGFDLINGYLDLNGLDPNDSGNFELAKQSATVDFWFSYKAANGKAFSQIQITPVVYNAINEVTLQYKDIDGIWTDKTSTSSAYQGTVGGSGFWWVFLNTYDFSSFSTLPNEVRVVVSGPSWAPIVSSVKLDIDVIPEPATLGLLFIGGLMILRKRA